MKRIAIALLGCIILASCGPKRLSGIYLAKGGGVGNGISMEKMEFGPGDRVMLTMLGQKIGATYKVDGKQMILILNGQQLSFAILDDGCLDGGSNFGKFCKS